ncbi:hypothetical protein [Albimonas pacifica]|uniref:hypothetical protein n=1 Tax=Albimonas pacifica TaxID=1114924 RepID=UPI000B88ECED|nr:hypothetical protein [Albimonas pacifica]
MKIPHIETLISRGPFSESAEWKRLRTELLAAVRAAEWPPGTGTFTIRPESGKKRGEGNGVKPIKDRTVSLLTAGRKYGEMKKRGLTDHRGTWVAEHPWPVGERIKPGNMDAAYVLQDAGIVCLEWETGNISSSHRSMNKMCLGLHKGSIKAGILVVPSRALYPFLTDRIGNIAELEPYFELWRSTDCAEGVLEIVVIEHDAVDLKAPRIPKGTDGRALT